MIPAASSASRRPCRVLPATATSMSTKATPAVLSNYSLALATAKIDKDILEQMKDELEEQGDYVGASQVRPPTAQRRTDSGN